VRLSRRSRLEASVLRFSQAGKQVKIVVGSGKVGCKALPWPPPDSYGQLERRVLVPPLAKPRATVTISQQVECRKTTVVARVKPSASGRFEVMLAAPAGARGAIYRLTSGFAPSRGSRHSFVTYSLPLPAVSDSRGTTADLRPGRKRLAVLGG
jgi:hypothetical protein